MPGTEEEPERLSPWWRNSVILVLVAGFAVLVLGKRPFLRGCPARSGARR